MARDKTFKMRLTEQEHALFMALANEHGVPAADIVRTLILGSESAQRLPSRDLLKQILRQLTGIGTNLNQAQKVVNEAHRSGKLTSAEAKSMYEAIEVGLKAWKNPRADLLKLMKRKP